MDIYKIIETHVVFEDEKIKEVFVLSEAWGNQCATKSTNQFKGGYYELKPDDAPTLELFKKVAAFGVKLNPKELKKHFPKAKF